MDNFKVYSAVILYRLRLSLAVVIMGLAMALGFIAVLVGSLARMLEPDLESPLDLM